MNARIGRRGRVMGIDEVIGGLGSAAGPDFRVAVRAQGVVLLRLGLALTRLVRCFMQRRRGRAAAPAHLSVPVAIRLQSDGHILLFLFCSPFFLFLFYNRKVKVALLLIWRSLASIIICVPLYIYTYTGSNWSGLVFLICFFYFFNSYCNKHDRQRRVILRAYREICTFRMIN